MSINKELIELAELAGQVIQLPPVSHMYLPEPDPGPDKNTEFGVVGLSDGSAGLYYAWLGDTQKGMMDRFPIAQVAGTSPLLLARYCLGQDEAERSLGLAAVNAITRVVFRRADFVPEAASDSLGSLDVRAGDHVGMVGYFPSLVRRLRDLGVKVTVVEKKTRFMGSDGTVNIVPDADALRDCNKVLSTASTLLNDSTDGILRCVAGAEYIVFVGPTAGFFPDPLFARGVTAIGGTEILDLEAVLERLRRNEPLGDSVRKFLLHRKDYPGTEHLLNNLTSGMKLNDGSP